MIRKAPDITMMSDEQQEMNPNQEAFLDFLKEHYQKDGEENSMSDEVSIRWISYAIRCHVFAHVGC